jgi:hypothetical protein
MNPNRNMTRPNGKAPNLFGMLFRMVQATRSER